MPKWAKDLGANCDACPLGLQQSDAVPPEGRKPSRFTILCESPGKSEETMGRPLVGVSGAMLNDALDVFGVEREECYLTNTIKCRPHRKLTGAEWKLARQCCRPLLEKEMEGVEKVIAMGQHAIAETTGKTQVTAWRGWPLPGIGPYEGKTVWPMQHPASLFRKPAELPIWLTDFARGLSFVDGTLPNFSWPREIIEVGDELLVFLNEVYHKKLTIAVDTEGTGLDPMTADITVIGLAAWENERVVASAAIDWPTESSEVKRLVLAILADPKIPKVLQNALYDWIALESHGITLEGIEWDTLYAGCVIAPQVAHDLGQQTSVAVGGNRWKSEFKVSGDAKGADRFIAVDRKSLLIYNARDCTGTLLLWDWQRKALAEVYRGEERFREMMALGRLGKRMKVRGMTVDPNARAFHLEKLSADVAKAKDEFLKMAEGVTNWQSIQQLHKFFFEDQGVQPTQFDKESGAPKLDAAALGDIAVGYPGTIPGRAAIALHWLREREKLLSTYVLELPVGRDGAVHPWWKFFTVTGRWSSSEPNMQNVPKPSRRKGADGVERDRPGMRDMFISRAGMWLVEADYSQLELRILALLAGDEPLLSLFAAGGDVHDANTEALFGIRKAEWDPEDFSRKRDFAKRFVYGLNYGGTDKTIHKSLVVNFPDLTVEAISDMRARWEAAHPAIATWQKDQLKNGEILKYVEAPLSGRRYRFYLGRVEPTICYNYPMQSTAADVVNRATLGLDEELQRTGAGHILLQVHDALVCEGPDPDALARAMKEHMNIEVELNGKKCRFPVDVKVGKSWGYMKKWAGK